MIKLPEELSHATKPFVVLTGLNITHNAIHQSIWDAFVNNRRESRLPLSLSCLPGDHAYPKCKNKRTSYDWYIPKGLLKTKWISKHLKQVPAVVVIFIELDWDDPAWQERHQACASRIQVVRASLSGRGTKLAVVLLQNKTPIPPGDDLGSSAITRANALCSTCELSAKSLFVLPITDQILGYVTRLEAAFFELAQSYYVAECKQIEAHKEFLNKTTHQLLFPRHQFKIAFFHEMMQTPGAQRKALKHYIQCYKLIQELRSYDTNNLEIKLIAGFVNYKICQISFLKLDSPTPLDAISQFRQHINHFKPLRGSMELLFEHSTWLSYQFSLFGELFECALNQGLTAIQTQHPGFYFHQAARYIRQRREFSRNLCPSSEDIYPNDDPLKDPLEFYGQRQWRQGQQRIDPPDMGREREGVLALQLQEAKFDHSAAIIQLLTQAISHVRKFKSHRLKLSLTVQMAEECFISGDFSKAITLLKRSMHDYAIDRWTLPLSNTLNFALHSTYLIGDIESFITLCVCAISESSGFSVDVQKGLQHSLLHVLAGNTPAYSNLSPIGVVFDRTKTQTALEHWQTSFATFNNLQLNMNSLFSFIYCKACFSSNETPVSSQATLSVFIKVTCPLAIRFTKLVVSFQDDSYNIEYVNNDKQSDLCFQSGSISHQQFQIPIHQSNIKSLLRVTSLTLHLQNQSNPCKDLKFTWQWQASKKSQLLPSDKTLLHQINTEGVNSILWSKIPTCLSTVIVERPSKLQLIVNHPTPALVNEFYPIKICLTSDEDPHKVASDITAMIVLKGDDFSLLYKETDDSEGHSSILRKLKDMQAGDKQESCVYFVSKSCSSVEVEAIITYKCNNNMSEEELVCSSTITKQFKIDVSDPFKFEFKTLSSSLQTLSSVKLHENFIHTIKISAVTSWKLHIVSSEYQLQVSDENFHVKHGTTNTLTDIYLQNGEAAIDGLQASITCPNFNQLNVHQLQLGTYKIKWKRLSTDDVPAVWTCLPIPPLKLEMSPISVTMSSPPYGVLHQKLSVKYRIFNSTDKTRVVEVRYDAVDSFTFSGNKFHRSHVLPFSHHNVPFHLFPLAVGYITLPKLTIKAIQCDKDIDTADKVDHSQLATHIYVKPTKC